MRTPKPKYSRTPDFRIGMGQREMPQFQALLASNQLKSASCRASDLRFAVPERFPQNRQRLAVAVSAQGQSRPPRLLISPIQQSFLENSYGFGATMRAQGLVEKGSFTIR